MCHIIILSQVQALLEANKPVRDGEFSPPEVDMIINKLGHLITSKPVIYLVNLTEKVSTLHLAQQPNVP